MAENKLSDRKIKSIKPSIKEQNIGDGGGLWLRVQAIDKGGAKSWYFRYVFGGKQKRFNLGQYPSIKLSAARNLRNDARETLAVGRDPAKFCGASPDAYTVRELAELWRDTVLKEHADKGSKIMRGLEYDLLKAIGDQAVTTVAYDQIISILEAMVKRGATVQASKLLSWSKQMFSFGFRRKILQVNPTAGIRAKDVGAGEKSRDRHLSWDELEKLAKQMKHAGLSERIEAALWLLFSTGVRSIELRHARIEHIDLKRKEWIIPKTKNENEHLIHLSKFSVKKLKILVKHSENGWLLSGSNPRRPVSSSLLRKRIGERIGTVNRKVPTKFHGTLALPGGPWRLHDCRRTMATRMGDLGVQPEVIEAALNHKPKGVMGVYQHQKYKNERKLAFDLWGKALEKINSK